MEAIMAMVRKRGNKFELRVKHSLLPNGIYTTILPTESEARVNVLDADSKSFGYFRSRVAPINHLFAACTNSLSGNSPVSSAATPP